VKLGEVSVKYWYWHVVLVLVKTGESR